MTDSDDMQMAIQEFLACKRMESEAKARRMKVEDWIIQQLPMQKNEGTELHKVGDLEVKINRRMSRKVDGQRLQELADEYSLNTFIPTLFRFKAEIKAKEWESAAENITSKFLDAITTTPGRASLTVKED